MAALYLSWAAFPEDSFDHDLSMAWPPSMNCRSSRMSAGSSERMWDFRPRRTSVPRLAALETSFSKAGLISRFTIPTAYSSSSVYSLSPVGSALRYPAMAR